MSTFVKTREKTREIEKPEKQTREIFRTKTRETREKTREKKRSDYHPRDVSETL